MVRTSLGRRKDKESGRGIAVHRRGAVRAATGVFSVVRTRLGGREDEEIRGRAVGGGAAVGAGSKGGRPVGDCLDGRKDEEVGAGGVGVHFGSLIRVGLRRELCFALDL